ncbi:uncharacterized protein N7511_001229 [Penicillium nucicola]|uniref:uncharacterized protein n=1 Tax=Penicillium nucicola TaxID=1850975 RepID=UPI002545BA73|nr:uncharacterized protein N7511_001229 [Penicillium nucicola]KAJ5776218.1 hypothetical protein N7511_001229 [Penicillium nucicola]
MALISTEPPIDPQQNFYDQDLQDLSILWSGMDASISLEGYFSTGFGVPTELISLPEFDIPGSANSALSGPLVHEMPYEANSECPVSDDDASLCNYQLPSLQQNDDSSSQDQERRHNIQDIPLKRCVDLPLSYPWRISREDYQEIITRIESFQYLLPNSFTFPSKYVFCRYVEGYFTGSHAHLPFLHLPTVKVAQLISPLILAIMAMGAQYRFERDRALSFYRASKALIDRHISVYSQSNSLHSPGSQTEYMDATEKEQFEILQSQIILTTLATWGYKDLLQDSVTMADHMSLYLRNSELLLHDRHSTEQSWEVWILQEGQRRTKLIAYTLSNIQTILFNMPPKILNSEIASLYLPWPDELWAASSAQEWQALHSKRPSCVSFRDGYSRLFQSRTSSRERISLSSFGNLLLIHALFQHIYLAWESAFCLGTSESEQPFSLPQELRTQLYTALKRWQSSWETSSDPSTIPSSPKGPLGFNATAIFRIACLRVHLNLGPHRNICTWDPEAIAAAFSNAPRPIQTPQVYHAVLQSIHSLSIPVRLGVEYVAKTQALTWSTIHSLCNLECALFLCKWLEALAMEQKDLHRDTRRLLRIINSVLCEADLSPSEDNTEEIGSDQLRQMGAVLIRLLSDILNGTHVFPMMDVFCQALRAYADKLTDGLRSYMPE